VLGHYGFEADEEGVVIFVGVVPVVIDVFFKYWIFIGLNKISPGAVVTIKQVCTCVCVCVRVCVCTITIAEACLVQKNITPSYLHLSSAFSNLVYMLPSKSRIAPLVFVALQIDTH
jgi:hypothetical protein